MFSKNIRIYYDYTDSQGFVYHSRYLDICERVRTDFLREKNIIQSVLFEKSGLLFVVRNLSIKYKKPAKLDDLVNINVDITNTSNFVIKMQQQVNLIERNQMTYSNELLTDLFLEIVMIDRNNHLVKIPKEILEVLN